jgi:hypothetical protein
VKERRGNKSQCGSNLAIGGANFSGQEWGSFGERFGREITDFLVGITGKFGY